MDNQLAVNGIAKKLGKILIENGLKILKSAFHISPIIYTRAEIMNFLSANGLPITSLSDEKYYTVDWATWLSLIEVDWTEEKKWYEDYYDCDNHAFTFGSRIPEIFDLNTAGVCYGQIYNKDTGNFIGNHAFNLIIAVQDGKLTPYLFEPMTGKWVLWIKGGKNVLDNWEYRIINWLILY
jgi:hypothetical protein